MVAIVYTCHCSAVVLSISSNKSLTTICSYIVNIAISSPSPSLPLPPSPSPSLSTLPSPPSLLLLLPPSPLPSPPPSLSPSLPLLSPSPSRIYILPILNWLTLLYLTIRENWYWTRLTRSTSLKKYAAGLYTSCTVLSLDYVLCISPSSPSLSLSLSSLSLFSLSLFLWSFCLLDL